MSLPSDSIRVAIISDTHGIIEPNIIDVIRSCDQVIHAGDICGAHIIDQLSQIHDDVTAVAGNNDIEALWAPEEAHVVNQLPQVIELDLPGGKLKMEHGHRHGMQKPCHDSLRKAHPDARVIVYGHTHSMLVDKDEDIWVINPGAAGHTRTRGGPSCLVLTASQNEWNVEMIRFQEEEVA